MEIKLKGHSMRTQKASELWVKIATELNAGLTPTEVAKKHINPKTKKPYTREYVYWVIEQLKTRSVN